MKRTLGWFAQSCGGELIGAPGSGEKTYTGVSSDTRTLKAGELFVALRGPRFNANDFVAAAEAAGAAGAVVDTRVDRPLAQILVRDTQQRASVEWARGFPPSLGTIIDSSLERRDEREVPDGPCDARCTAPARGSPGNCQGLPRESRRTC